VNTLIVTIEFRTPWHAGTGVGAGARADAVVHTRNGLPVLPNTMLKGLARDRGEVIEMAFGAKGLVDTVFGSTRGDGSWHFGTATVLEQPADGEPLVHVARHNKHDPDTGRVPDDFYFTLEVARPTVLTAVVEPMWPDRAISDVERAFVAASLMAVDRLGARRQRGWGRCQVSVSAGAEGPNAQVLLEPLLGLGAAS
jgi:hypothetical protein